MESQFFCKFYAVADCTCDSAASVLHVCICKCLSVYRCICYVYVCIHMCVCVSVWVCVWAYVLHAFFMLGQEVRGMNPGPSRAREHSLWVQVPNI